MGISYQEAYEDGYNAHLADCPIDLNPYTDSDVNLASRWSSGWYEAWCFQYQNRSEVCSSEIMSPSTCPRCGSRNIVKNGRTSNGKQNYKCTDCCRQFIFKS